MNATESPVEVPTEESANFYQPAPARSKETRWEQIGGGALTFSVALSLVMLVVLAFWYFAVPPTPPKGFGFIPPGGGGGERGTDTKVNTKRMQQLIPNTNVKRVAVDNPLATVSIPDPGEDFGEMSPLVSLSRGGMSGGPGDGPGDGPGRGPGRGPGVGPGDGIGKLFGPPIPPILGKRCAPEDRLARIKETGGTPACEDAVVKALRWLKANQQADGSWNGQSKVAMTGLALLAYFGHCETPASKEFGVSCLKAITYLVDIGLKNDGRLADNYAVNNWCYQHAIATYALAEATTFCRLVDQQVPGLAEVTGKAGQFIIDNQHQNGGWAYSYVLEGGHTDVSIVGWQLQALKACSHSGIKFPRIGSAVADGLKYIATCQNENGGYGYTGPVSAQSAYFTLTGVGMLSHQMWGKGKNAGVRKAAKYVAENTRFDYNGENCDLYGHYYESQAMMQMGGEYWKNYNNLFRDELLNNQNADGSWKVPGGGKVIRAVAPSFQSDSVYRTCLCTLMLEVYYRFLSTDGVDGRRLPEF